MKNVNILKNRIVMLMICLISAISLAGCGNEKDERNISVYYINEDNTGFIESEYKLTSSDAKNSVTEVMNLLSANADGKNKRSPLDMGFSIKQAYLEGSTVVIYVDSYYNELVNGDVLLVEASLTLTLTQIKGVDSINIIEVSGKESGKLYADKFVVD